MKKGVYRLEFDCGRMGVLEGTFVATDKEVEILLKENIEVYFGEVLGKHSEITGGIDEGEIVLLTDNQDVVKAVEEYDLSSGTNPFYYPTYIFEVSDDVEPKQEEYDVVQDLIEEIIEYRK